MTRLLKCLVALIAITPLYTLAVPFNSVPSAMEQVQPELININRATLKELTILPGIGKKKAEAIIQYREENGQFTSLDQLMEIKGIGKKVLEKLEGKVSF